MRDNIIDGVLFDFDATLTEPHAINFGDIKLALGCPLDSMILDHIESLRDEATRNHALAVLTHHERIAAEASLPAAGSETLVLGLRRHGLRVGILTRNSSDSVQRALKNFAQLTASHFDVIVSRDDPVPVKPDPDSVRYAARAMGLSAHRLLMVGDHRYDIDAGREAGSWTCLIIHQERPDWADEVAADYEIRSLDQIWSIVTDYHR